MQMQSVKLNLKESGWRTQSASPGGVLQQVCFVSLVHRFELLCCPSAAPTSLQATSWSCFQAMKCKSEKPNCEVSKAPFFSFSFLLRQVMVKGIFSYFSYICSYIHIFNYSIINIFHYSNIHIFPYICWVPTICTMKSLCYFIPILQIRKQTPRG